MKYIKIYEEFFYSYQKSEDTNDIIHQVDDILIEFNDQPKIQAKSWKETDRIVVIITLVEEDIIEDDEVVQLDQDSIEAIKRLLDYMTNIGFKYEIEIGTDNIPPGIDGDTISDYRRNLEYDELNYDIELYQDEYIRIDLIEN